MNVKSYQDLKFLGKQIFPKFSYFLINSSLLCHFLANRLAYKKKITENLFSAKFKVTLIFTAKFKKPFCQTSKTVGSYTMIFTKTK